MPGVTRFTDLDAWKLAVDLRDPVYELTEAGPSGKDFKFLDQIRASANSAPSNIAEGWGRFYPNDNAQFLRVARASLMETQNHLLHGKTRNYFSAEAFERAWILSRRALGATTRLMQYQISCDGQVPGQPKRRTKRPRT